MRVPEIIIVGTMKGGTTILYDYIATHPQVVRGTKKEIHYFSLYPNLGLQWYREQFPDRAPGILSIDASPTYFDVAVMPTVPAYIKKEAPEAKIILIVRDPVARAISHVQHLRLVSNKDLFETIDVDEFLSRPLERCYTHQHSSDVHLSHVLGFSVYDDKFLNYVRVFGRENILVLTNEELSSDPLGTMRKVFAHCGLSWVASDLFGTRKYMSGSERLSIAPAVRERLEGLLYPSYERFCRRAGLQRMAKPVPAA